MDKWYRVGVRVGVRVRVRVEVRVGVRVEVRVGVRVRAREYTLPFFFVFLLLFSLSLFFISALDTELMCLYRPFILLRMACHTTEPMRTKWCSPHL